VGIAFDIVFSPFQRYRVRVVGRGICVKISLLDSYNRRDYMDSIHCYEKRTTGNWVDP